ncbi:2230_t:CDS:2, partial [Acaulospora morrowiae]
IISEDDKSLSNTSVSVSNTEVSPNNTTLIFSHEVTASSNSFDVDEMGEVKTQLGN